VRYSQITLDKPTLEDYFLMLARRKDEGREDGREAGLSPKDDAANLAAAAQHGGNAR